LRSPSTSESTTTTVCAAEFHLRWIASMEIRHGFPVDRPGPAYCVVRRLGRRFRRRDAAHHAARDPFPRVEIATTHETKMSHPANRRGRKVPSIICATRIRRKFSSWAGTFSMRRTSILRVDRAAPYDGKKNGGLGELLWWNLGEIARKNNEVG